MAFQWRENDQIYLLEAMNDYRSMIENKNLKDAKKITLQFARNLHKTTPGLQHRSVGSIEQRLPYLDNLLAGALNVENYANKDQFLFNWKPRKGSNKEFNACNTRHSYNGYLC